MLLSFYDFPAEHWIHIRTTNPIEIDVRDGAAAARQDEGERHPGGVPDDGVQADGERSKGWRSLNGSPLLAEVVRGTKFIDGIKEKPAA